MTLGWIGRPLTCLVSAGVTMAAGPEPDLEAKARAFLQQPAQVADIRAALEAKARTTPHLCPALVTTPEQLFLKMPPPARFDAAGAMVEGSARQRYTTSGCGSFRPIFNVWVITAQGLPTRTVAAYSGTTMTFIDLQEQATPVAKTAAGQVLDGCGSMSVIDTKLVGYDTPTGDDSRPWREMWLLGGCGMFAQVRLHFLPDREHQRTTVEATPEGAKKVDLP